MKKVKILFFTSIVVSLALFVFGLYIVIYDSSYFQGMLMMGLGFSIGINDWIKLLKKKHKEAIIPLGYTSIFRFF